VIRIFFAEGAENLGVLYDNVHIQCCLCKRFDRCFGINAFRIDACRRSCAVWPRFLSFAGESLLSANGCCGVYEDERYQTR